MPNASKETNILIWKIISKSANTSHNNSKTTSEINCGVTCYERLSLMLRFFLVPFQLKPFADILFFIDLRVRLKYTLKHKKNAIFKNFINEFNKLQMEVKNKNHSALLQEILKQVAHLRYKWTQLLKKLYKLMYLMY